MVGQIGGVGPFLISWYIAPKIPCFIKSVDALAHVKDASLLCELINGFIEEIGFPNVVQIITDNAANYVVAGKMLMERHRSLL